MRTNFRTQILASLTLLILSLGVYAQGIDPGYNPFPGKRAYLEGGQIVPLADGKLLTLHYYTNGRALSKVNSDGSVDTSFNCTACNFTIYTIAVQPDGKYLIGGSGTNPSGTRLIRANPDGSLDGTFSNGFSGIANAAEPRVYATGTDGKIYASVVTTVPAFTGTLYRLNSDGSIDNTFTPLAFTQFFTNTRINNVTILSDGKVLVTGKHQSFGDIFRLNTDGTRDTAWTSPVLMNTTDTFNPPRIFNDVVQADGKVVIAGAFTHVNALNRFRVARLTTDSGVDSAFVTLPFNTISPWAEVVAQSDGKIIVGAQVYSDNTRFKRINADLTTDNTYLSPADAGATVNEWTVDSNNKVVYIASGQMKRLNTDGSADNTFNFTLIVPAESGAAVALQNDGKAIVTGQFEFMNGAYQPTIARLNTDGTRDATLNPGTGFDSGPSKLIVQPDGKILAFGAFNSFNGTSRPRLARLNNDGSLDAAFVPNVNNVNTILLQPDGKILLLGGNMAVNGFARSGVARLNSDGTLDTGYQVFITVPGIVTAVLHPDGKLTIAGVISTVNSVGRTNIARLNANGSLDETLDAGINMPTGRRIALQPDGKYIVATSNPSGLIRLNANGTVDPTFSAPGFSGSAVNDLAVETNGCVILAGTFSSPQPNIVRLSPKGKRDIQFVFGGANAVVNGLAVQADNKVIAIGNYTSIGGVTRPSIARINFAPFRARTPFDFDGDGRADVSVTRQADFMWYQLTGVAMNYSGTQFGSTSDKVTPGDYDGDGKTDISIFHPATGDWWYKNSSNGVINVRHWGQNGDLPLPGDFDGDGRTDFAIVRNYTWYVANFNGIMIQAGNFGQAGDKPITGDFDGDGKTDLAVFRPSSGDWIYAASASGGVHTVVHWGISTDTPVPADYDGDGKTDMAVYRASEGNWYVLFSGNGGFLGLHFGISEDKPVAADYDGDGMTDLAVYRPSDGYWYFLRTTEGFTGFPFGIASDIPTPNAFVPPTDPPRLPSGKPKR